MSSCPDYLVCTDGHIEPVTDPMSRAWEFKNREAFLANRVLHSLDGQSVLMSDEDYEAVRGLVSAAMADTGEQASRIFETILRRSRVWRRQESVNWKPVRSPRSL